MSSRALSRYLPFLVVGGTAATLGYMYVAGSQVKKEEGPASIFKTEAEGAGLKNPVSDAKMNSKDVREAVQGERKS